MVEDETYKKYESLLWLVKPEYHLDFVGFVETGEASKEFLDHVEKDVGVQRAIDYVFNKQAKAFEELAKNLKKL